MALTADQQAAILALWHKGWHVNRIARHLGHTWNTVRALLGPAYESRTHSPRREEVRPSGHRYRAQRRWPDLGLCQDCGQRRAVDRHHADGDVTNDEPANVALLCRKCHMQRDGRLAQLVAGNKAGRPRPVRPGRKPGPPRPCHQCARLSARLRRGLCPACYARQCRQEKKGAGQL